MSQNSRIAWHYATGPRAAEILREGVLKGSAETQQRADAALVWFSLRQHWDPIANAAEHESGGAWRFGLPASELVSWRQAAATLSRDAARALERAGRRAGSDPGLWLASREPVAIDRCRIEHLHGDRWCSADHGDGPA